MNVSNTNQDMKLLLLEDPGRDSSQITSVVCLIQRFDLDLNLAMTQKSNNGDTADFRLKTSIWYDRYVRYVHVRRTIASNPLFQEGLHFNHSQAKPAWNTKRRMAKFKALELS